MSTEVSNQKKKNFLNNINAKGNTYILQWGHTFWLLTLNQTFSYKDNTIKRIDN